MRILVLGGDGMLGHQLLQSYHTHHDIRVTLRRPLADYVNYGVFNAQNSYSGIDAQNFSRVTDTVYKFKPQVIINAVGIVKQRDEAQDAIPSIEINSLFPHRLSQLCGETNARLIHLSTDCVFSGSRGMYTEDDREDATDLYGRSKLLGEVKARHAVTIRTSIIGLELSRKRSLIEWFLMQTGVIRGFTKAIYSGFTTREMARVIEFVLLDHPSLSGLWHVSSPAISKYDLLRKLSEKLGRDDVKIHADSSFSCDRSLDGSRFIELTGYAPPSWDNMLDEMAEDIQERLK